MPLLLLLLPPRRIPSADDKLKTLFTGTKCNMFKLQKHLSKHCKTSGGAGWAAAGWGGCGQQKG